MNMTRNEWTAKALEEVERGAQLPEDKLPAKIKIYDPDTKIQSTRLLKAVCPECGYTVRVTKKWADTGLPVCCFCVVEFKLEEKKEEEE